MIDSDLDNENWQNQAIKEALLKADSKEAKFVDHEKVVAWLNSWGTKNELQCPR